MSMYIKKQNGLKKIPDIAIKTDVHLITKAIIANGTYNAIDDEADGYSTVTINVGEVAENDFMTFNTGYVMSNAIIDLREPFDIIVCFALATADMSVVRGIIGSNASLVTTGAQISVDTDGSVYGFLFYGGTNDWQHCFLVTAPSTMLVINGITKNFVKLSRTVDDKLTMSHSLDGKHFTMYAEQEITPETSFTYPTAPVAFGGYAQYNATNLLPANRLSLLNCCIKQNNNVIWGREI